MLHPCRFGGDEGCPNLFFSLLILMSRTEETLTKAADFISMMRSSLPEQKLIAAKQIPFIAEQIGPERTVNELLPFLPGMLSDMYVFS